MSVDKLYSFNIHETIDNIIVQRRHLANKLRLSIKNNNGKPYQIYTGTNSIEAYKDMVLPQEAVDKCNEEGLSIYLYEPICAYDVQLSNSDRKYTDHFYSEFESTINYDNLRSEELDSIIEFKEKNKLTKVTVHTCDYDIREYFKYYTDKLDLITDDIFLKAEEKIIIENNDYSSNREFTHKFISLNYRYTYHRHLLACYLAQTEDVIMSWAFKSDLEFILQSNWYQLSNLDTAVTSKIEYGLSLLNDKVPMNIDFDIEIPAVIKHSYFKNLYPTKTASMRFRQFNKVEKMYSNIFCEIVGETRFAQPSANYSEKVYRPMSYMRPFIIAAPPYTLKYMREQGFKTFSDFWDESYDEIRDHEKRLVKIFEVIDFINNMSMSQCTEMYEQMLPIIHHNLLMVHSKALLLNIRKNNQFFRGNK